MCPALLFTRLRSNPTSSAFARDIAFEGSPLSSFPVFPPSSATSLSSSVSQSLCACNLHHLFIPSQAFHIGVSYLITILPFLKNVFLLFSSYFVVLAHDWPGPNYSFSKRLLSETQPPFHNFRRLRRSLGPSFFTIHEQIAEEEVHWAWCRRIDQVTLVLALRQSSVLVPYHCAFPLRWHSSCT